MAKIGEIAPDFALPNQDGEIIRLSDLRGQQVLLFAYPKAGTSGCTMQACGFRDSFPRFMDLDVIVLGISPDAPEDLRKWRAEENLPYDLLSDLDHQVLKTWNAWGERTINGQITVGVIRSHWIIDEMGKIVAAEENISPAESVDRATRWLLA